MSFGYRPPRAAQIHAVQERTIRDEVEAVTDERTGACLLMGRSGRRIRIRRRNAPKEVLLVAGIISSATMGGGLIFGFSPFADKLTKLKNAPFTSSNVSSVFTVGHNIAAWGCIVSGFVLDTYGPRITVMAGLFIESIGHLLLMNITRLPGFVAYIGFGLLGLGGCKVLLAALTFADAFKNSGLAIAIVTAAFQAGGFVFMVLPYVPWEGFFFFYTIMCLVAAVVLGFLYPSQRLQPYAENEGASDMDAMTSAIAGSRTFSSILLRPGTVGFLLTFMVAGSALTYGIGEFTPALKSKDDCQWDESIQDFINCKDESVQDTLNNVLMPLVGNFIVPCSLAYGTLIDKTGFPLASFLNVFFVQAFITVLWALSLKGQYFTLIVYNMANTVVWTMQNAYICAVGHDHIGALFGVSNLVLGVGNLIADWMSLNPFGAGDTAISESLTYSSLIWIVACFPLYAWPLIEYTTARSRRKATEGRLHHASVAGFAAPPIPDGAFAATMPRSTPNSWRSLGPESANKTWPQNAGGGNRRMEQVEIGAATNLLTPMSVIQEPVSVNRYDASIAGESMNIHHPVITVNPTLWDQKVAHILKLGRNGIFFVVDFDRTITRCFLEDGRRALDCHDILASIPKITRDCKQTMEDLMEKYYPIEIHPHMTREQKIPHMVEWYRLVNEVLAEQGLTRADVETAVRLCKDFRLRHGSEELFQLAYRLSIPVVVMSAGLGNVIEEVLRQCVRKPDGSRGTPWPNVRVLSNTLLWDEGGNFRDFSEPLIHMYNKSLQDAPADIRSLLHGRTGAIICGDGTGDLTMAHGHPTDVVLKFGFLNERVEERLFRYVGEDLWDKVVLNDGTFEPLLSIVRQI